MRLVSQAWHFFVSTLQGFDSPQQIALGITVGMIIGLLPKTSGIPYLIAIASILTNANLISVVASAIAFSLISPHLDGLFHPVGAWLLTYDPFETFWTSLLQLPGARWFQLQNTVVTGSLAFAVLLAIPSYSLSLQVVERYGSTAGSLIRKNPLVRWLVGPTTPEIQNNLQQS